MTEEGWRWTVCRFGDPDACPAHPLGDVDASMHPGALLTMAAATVATARDGVSQHGALT